MPESDARSVLPPMSPSLRNILVLWTIRVSSTSRAGFQRPGQSITVAESVTERWRAVGVMKPVSFSSEWCTSRRYGCSADCIDKHDGTEVSNPFNFMMMLFELVISQ